MRGRRKKKKKTLKKGKVQFFFFLRFKPITISHELERKKGKGEKRNRDAANLCRDKKRGIFANAMCVCVCVCGRERERTGMGSVGGRERNDARFKPDLQTFFSSSGFGKSDIREGIKNLGDFVPRHGTYATKIHTWSPHASNFALHQDKYVCKMFFAR